MQVWLGNRRVGEAKLSPRLGSNQITVSIMDEPFSMAHAVSMSDPVPQPRVLILKIGVVRFQISERDEMIHGARYSAEIFNKHGVLPSDCTVIEQYDRMTKVYEYRVVKVNRDQLEEIFDCDWFEPSDGGEPDRDYFERRREEMMRTPFGL